MRKLMLFTIGFGAACALCAYWFIGSATFVLAALLLIFGLVFGLMQESFRLQKQIALVLIGLSLGFIWYQGHFLMTAPGELPEGERVSLTLEASDYGYDTGYGTAVDAVTDGRVFPAKVRLYLNENVKIRPGDLITGSFRVRYTDPQWNEDNYFFASEGIRLMLSGGKDVMIRTPEGTKWYLYPAVWRQSILGMVERLFPDDTMPFAKALLLGDTSDLSYRTKTDLTLSGLRHVAAVSGLHVSILFSFVYFVLRKRKNLTTVVMLPLLAVFAAVSGFSPSVVRACVMHIMMQIAFLLGKENDEPTALSAAVLLLLLFNPQCIMSVGLQLSVGSVVGIQLFSKRFHDAIMKWKIWGEVRRQTLKSRLLHWFSSGVAVSISASVVTIPFTAIYFGTVNLLSVISNLLCLWIINWIFCGIIVVCLVGSVWLLQGRMLAGVVSWLIRYVLWVAGLMGKFPMSCIYTESPYVSLGLMICFILFAVYLSGKLTKARYAFISIVVTLLLAVSVSWAEPYFGEFRVSVLDVGQGQSVLIQSEGKNYLVDCGGDHDEATADTVSAQLGSRGVFRLDGIILSHYDRDHVGAVPYLLQRVKVNTVYLPSGEDPDGFETPIREHTDADFVAVKEDLLIPIGDGMIRIFAGSDAQSDNERSLCILFQKANYDILITGDRGMLGEAELILEEELPQLEALVVGHHGADTSTSAFLLETLRPQTAVISVGAGNNYDHPAQAVLDRLEEYGCKVRRTDLEGTIVLTG